MDVNLEKQGCVEIKCVNNQRRASPRVKATRHTPSADKRISKLCKARGGDNLKRPPAAAAVALRAELGGTGNDKDARQKIHLLPLWACANIAAQQL